MHKGEPDFARVLLDWYDAHARDLPWRVPPGSVRQPDPYRIWLSEVMLQQTTVAAVSGYFATFTQRWPDVGALAAADDADVMAAWAGLGYYARARNLLKCARMVAGEYDGVFPDSAAALQRLPGIGPYTAAAIAAIAYGQSETVVDGNVDRVISRLFAIETPLPDAKPDIRARAGDLTPSQRPGDYAQAMMDLGATICTPSSPNCLICPVTGFCTARARGIAAELPKKRRKPPKPVRRGYAYVLVNSDSAVLLERRPDKGLLGGMLGWPGSAWEDNPDPVPPVDADWRAVGEVRHTFTHFHLRLAVMIAISDARPERGAFLARDAFRPGDLPTVMKKVHYLAASIIDSV